VISKEQFLEPIKDAITKSVNHRPWDGYIHPSALFDCPMSWYNHYHGLKKREPNFATASILLHGVALHEKYQDVLKKFGNLIVEEYPITYEKYRLTGAVDAISEYNDNGKNVAIVWDIKTVDGDKFREIPDNSAYIQHELQLMFYIFMLKNSPTSAYRYIEDYGYILYVNRQYSVLDARPVILRNDVIDQVLAKIDHFFDSVHAQTVPTKFLRCGTALACGNCRFQKKKAKEFLNDVQRLCG
jgi:CRISPR/Cas system-associated exonuclease Cas4 (RecB family)